MKAKVVIFIQNAMKKFKKKLLEACFSVKMQSWSIIMRGKTGDALCYVPR